MTYSASKLNLGCGYSHKTGFLNVDARQEVYPDLCGDIMSIDCTQESLEEIYISHTLEHLCKDDAVRFVERLALWLKPGGKLHIAVPDLQTICRLIASGDSNEILMHWLYGATQEVNYMRHKWGYTRDTLIQMLEKVGLRILGDYKGDDDDSSFEYNGMSLSINLECVK